VRLQYELGNDLGVAYPLELPAWLAGQAGRCERAAWLLGSASVLWRKADAVLPLFPGGVFDFGQANG
jgi:hypothetical protein